MRLQRLLRKTVGLGALLFTVGCAGGGEATPPPDEDSPRPLTSAIRRLRRLSSREYNNVVRDLLGDASRPAARFLKDAYQNGYDNGSAELAVQSDQVVDYQGAAEALAQSAVQLRLGELTAGCDVTQQGYSGCAEAFLASFAPRAYRRPLTAAEQQRLRVVFQAELAAGSDFPRALQTMLEVILQSPQFLYREELGPMEAAPGTAGSVHLTDYEVAAQLSFLLAGSLPDQELWTAVRDGRFTTVDDYRREAARLLASPLARDTLRSFLHQWLATDRLATLSKDSSFYPSFNQALAGSMSGELNRFYDSVLWSSSGSLRELFASNQSFLDEKLGQLYGVPVSGPGFHPVTLDVLRKGVLSRAGFLAVHSATDSSGPISRGVFLLQALLCLPPPQPPANVPPALPAGDPGAKDLTTRQRFEKHVKDPFCAACHKQIDGVGFGMEQFDGIGAFRTMENGHPVDSSGALVGTGEIDGAYNGTGELASRMAGSHTLADCYVRNAYRFAMGQIEPTGEDLRTLNRAFSSDARLTEVLLTLIASPLFVNRSFEAVKP